MPLVLVVVEQHLIAGRGDPMQGGVDMNAREDVVLAQCLEVPVDRGAAFDGVGLEPLDGRMHLVPAAGLVGPVEGFGRVVVPQVRQYLLREGDEIQTGVELSVAYPLHVAAV